MPVSANGNNELGYNTAARITPFITFLDRLTSSNKESTFYKRIFIASIIYNTITYFNYPYLIYFKDHVIRTEVNQIPY